MDHKTLVVGVPKFSRQNGWWRLSAALHIEGTQDSILPAHQKEMWFSLPEEYAEEFVFPDCSDCFLFGLLYYAMRFGYNIHIQGTVSKEVLYNVKNELMPIMAAFRSCLRPIDITAVQTRSYPKGKYVGTGFSAGIDSFYTIVGNLKDHLFPEDKLTHLFFFNVGTHDLGRSFEELDHARKKFLMRYESFVPAAKEIGLPFIPVDSNVHSFLPDNIAAGISVSNAAAVHFLRKGVWQYLLSSDGRNYLEWFKYIKTSPWEEQIDLAHMELVLCQWLGDRTLWIKPYGTNVTRLEKTEFLVDYPPARHCLNVCNSVDMMEKNCSVCLKCRRTMLDLELLGKLDEFRSVFDVDMFRTRFKSRDFAELMYPPPEHENQYLNNSRAYAIRHGIDIKSQSAAVDRICAYMHQTWIYQLLDRVRLLDAVKRLLGRHKQLN